MTKALRNIVLVVLPVLTLFMGWQIGAEQERSKLQKDFSEMDYIFQGGVGSGHTVVDPEEEVDITLLWSVWRLLAKNYIEPEELDTLPMLHGAVDGLVREVGDPYTTFMKPKENKEFRQSLNGTLQGIGAELTMREEDIVVVAPLKGSPAEDAGVLPEDIITHVDGNSIEGYSLSDAVDIIRGPKGTKVILTVARESADAPVEIPIIRDKITVPSTEAELKEYEGKQFGYIGINRFAQKTTEEVRENVEEFVSQNVDGMIVDVRFNGGGYLDKAVDLTSLFLRKGKVVTVERRGGEPTVHYVSGRPIAEDVPLVILINEGSASASEILAGALQDAGRATVIGKTSFGKGTVQEVFDLPGGTSIRITTARWLTPSGRDLGKEGITPDIEVDRTREDMEAELDPQMDAALKNLSENK